jgi:hypothetical protein
MEDFEKDLKWIMKHLRYTQALCEIILEKQAEILTAQGKPVSKNQLIEEVHKRVKEI